MSENTYDRYDVVRREAAIIADGAGSLKLAAYRVRDPSNNGEFGPLQFHATFNNIVLCLMGEEAAKLFARFVRQTVGDEPRVMPVDRDLGCDNGNAP